MWYAKNTEERLNFVHTLPYESESVSSSANNADTYNLFELTRTDEIQDHYDSHLSNVEVADFARKHLKPRFPFVKMSINCGGGCHCVDLEIQSSPFAKNTDELKAILNYCDKYIDSYRKCIDYDPYGDYGSSYNFYGSCNIASRYEQKEETEESKAMSELFQSSKEAYEQEEVKKKEEEAKRMQEEYQRQKEECIRLAKIRKENHDKVESSAVIKDCLYYVGRLIDYGTCKNDSIDEYHELEKDDSCYEKPSFTRCLVSRDVYFDKENYKLFSQMLLDDWSFINGTGGTETNDERIGSLIDYENMSQDEQKTVEWFSTDCVAVYCDCKLMFVVNAEGFSYCKYVYMACDETEIYPVSKPCPSKESINNRKISDNIVSYVEFRKKNGVDLEKEENQNDVIAMIESISDEFCIGVIQSLSEEHNELKKAMYKAVKVMSGCQYRFKKACLMAGQKLTIVKIGDFGGIYPKHITLKNISYQKYAQHEDAVRLEFRPEKKRSDYYQYLHGDCLVYNGWLPELPENVLYDVVSEGGNYIMKNGKYMSHDHRQYDEVMAYYGKLGYSPIVNTYNPFKK